VWTSTTTSSSGPRDHGEAALARDPPSERDRVLDSGCGLGDTTQRIADLVPHSAPGDRSWLRQLPTALGARLPRARLGDDVVYAANVVCGLIGLFVTVGLEIPRHARLEKGGRQPA
jgi:hypothetical protein